MTKLIALQPIDDGTRHEIGEEFDCGDEASVEQLLALGHAKRAAKAATKADADASKGDGDTAGDTGKADESKASSKPPAKKRAAKAAT